MPNRNACVAILFVLLFFAQPSARAYDALEVCRNQSPLTSAIHDCMDNYLDLLDSNLNDLTRFIDATLRGGERAAFNRAQNAFYSYRRENCLWYLEISDSRVAGEQVAKNCLANMSQQRLSELQGLIAEYENPGAADALAEAAETAVAGTDETANEVSQAAELAATTDEQPASDEVSPDDDSEGLSAFLGDWQVTCVVDDGARRCTLDVPLVPQGAQTSDSTLRIIRRSNERATAEVRFPGTPIDNPDKILWRVDNFSFGAVPGSIITVSSGVTRQVINERRFIRDDLMPLFRSGTEVGITVLGADDDASTEEYESTLVGFSRALSFADEYIDGEL